jgi:beta-lactamase class A
MKLFTMKIYIPVFLLLFIFCISCRTATNSSTTGDNRKREQLKKQAAGVTSCQDNATLQNQIETLIRTHRAKVGVAIRFGDKETITCNDSTRYAMMSTFKFPLALAVLSKLDKKQLPLETEIYVTPSDLHPNTYSPLRDTRPEGSFKISISELLRYTVTLSDNNACDILIHYLGGPAAIQDYLTRTGISGITIVATENTMHQQENPYLNHCHPSAMTELLEKFLSKTLLSAPYQNFLEKLMLATSTGADKLKGLLPPGTPVGHKTGSSDRNANGQKAGDNDVGFIRLPDGRYFTIAVFIMDSAEDDKANALLIARIARSAYEHYSQTPTH